jgi:Zn-finger nucleic acid-binding protein
MWLDRGELEKLVALEGAAASDEDFLSEVTGKRNNAGPAPAEDDESRASGRKCRGSLLQNFLDFGGE